MPPSIVITEPVPRWKVWAQLTLRVGSLMLLCVVSFYAGMQYERHPRVDTVNPTAAASEATRAAVPLAREPAPQSAPQDMYAQVLESRALEGLQIQTLEVTRDAAAPGQLRYDFAIFNEGRPYEGSFEFVVLGLQDGRVVQWSFPSASAGAGSAYRLRVSRYLKMGGKIDLPPGLTPQALALRLREPRGIRASRGVELRNAGLRPSAGPSAQ